jgi:hypothetical protein
MYESKSEQGTTFPFRSANLTGVAVLMKPVSLGNSGAFLN